LGNAKEKEKIDDEICMLETNIDDMNPEILGYVMNRLFENVHWMYSIRPFT